MSKSAPLRETDLYPPLRDYLVAQGYTVRAEVRGCDVTATRGDELIVIEMKTGFTTDLLIQAADRQRAAESVYVALPRPKRDLNSARWRGIKHLLRRLELGLILISTGTRPVVDVAFHPIRAERRRNVKENRALLREIGGRSGDYNTGGSSRYRIMTAYRENALFIAVCLERFGPMTPRGLRALGTGPKTLSILSRNVYNWFDRQGRGLYALRAAGIAEIEEYPDLVAYYRTRVTLPDDHPLP